MGEDSARLEYGKFGENCQVFDGWPIFSPIFSPHRAHRAPGTGKWCEPDSPRHWESTNYGDKAWGRIRLDWNMANSGEIVKQLMGGLSFLREDPDKLATLDLLLSAHQAADAEPDSTLGLMRQIAARIDKARQS